MEELVLALMGRLHRPHRKRRCVSEVTGHHFFNLPHPQIPNNPQIFNLQKAGNAFVTPLVLWVSIGAVDCLLSDNLSVCLSAYLINKEGNNTEILSGQRTYHSSPGDPFLAKHDTPTARNCHFKIQILELPLRFIT